MVYCPYRLNTKAKFTSHTSLRNFDIILAQQETKYVTFTTFIMCVHFMHLVQITHGKKVYYICKNTEKLNQCICQYTEERIKHRPLFKSVANIP
jgi:hypothetical protein